MIISPSLLSADFGILKQELEELSLAGADCCIWILWTGILCPISLLNGSGKNIAKYTSAVGCAFDA